MVITCQVQKLNKCVSCLHVRQPFSAAPQTPQVKTTRKKRRRRKNVKGAFGNGPRRNAEQGDIKLPVWFVFLCVARVALVVVSVLFIVMACFDQVFAVRCSCSLRK